MINLPFTAISEQLGTSFFICPHEYDNPIEFTLTEAIYRGASSTQEHFLLVFQGPNEPILPQKIYQFKHQRIGEFDIFIVPVGRNQIGVQYEAVFNRLLIT